MKLDVRLVGAAGAGVLALFIVFGLGFYVRIFEPLPHRERMSPATEAEVTRPCAVDVDDRRSDLCAQWKAADAARSSADAAWLFGAVGSWIGICTLLAAGLAAKYARDAALEAKKAAEAATITVDEARHANTIARNIDRPWIAPSATLIAFEKHGSELRFKFETIYKNVGRMAAENVELKSILVCDPRPTDVVKSLLSQFLNEDRPFVEYSVIIPDGHLRSEMQGGVDLNSPVSFGVATPRMRIVIAAFCRYKLPGDELFKYSATTWYLRRNGPRSPLPLNAGASSPSIRIEEFDFMTASDFELVRSMVSAS